MHSRLPFEILPTKSIVGAPLSQSGKPKRQRAISITPPVQSMSSTVAATRKPVIPREVKELDEEQGKRIIALIYERDGSMEKKGTIQVNQAIQGSQQQQHKASYYIDKQNTGSSSNNTPKSEVKKEMNFLDKVSDYLAIESKSLIKLIDRDLLIENGITIEDLVGPRCDIGITDLMSAGIVSSIHDLRLLGFKMSDIVINRKRFQAQQLADLFQLNYEQLRKMKGVKFSALDLVRCKFYPNELAALNFSFDYMINNNGLNATQLRCLDFSLADLVSLQFAPEHLDTLEISRHQALHEFKWDRKVYNEFVNG